MPEAKGIDISSWQHPDRAAIDWEAVRGAGIEFVLVKATQGTTYVNPWLKADLSDARAEGLLVGAYHFVESDAEPAEQADAFLAAVLGESLDVGAWIDWECPELPDFAIHLLYDPLYGRLAEVRGGVGLYCDLAWLATFQRLLKPIPRLWLADPSSETPAQKSLLWQHATGSVAGISGEVDLDVMRSTRGFNIPTSPAGKPSALPVDPHSDEERAQAAAGVTREEAVASSS